jgi:hypothetical protein
MATKGDYYILPGTGTIQQQHNSVLAFALLQAGFAGPFATIAEAKAYAKTQTVQNAVHSAGATVSNAVGSTAGFISTITNRDFIVRAVKVVIGTALIIVGVAQLTGATKVVETVAMPAAKVAGAVSK